ncbi:MAG: MobF family relaxase, partial [Acidimicrobiales bacterium]
HYDSRSGDPQLHDHVVVWNRAKSQSDGQWRTLDSRGLFKQVVTLGVMHEGVLADMLTDALGVGWDAATTRHGMTKHEIIGVPEALMAEFSKRVAMIHTRRDELIAEFSTAHGREPNPVEKVRLAQRANLETRPDKQHRSLSEMTKQWRERAAPYLDDVPVSFVTGLKDRNDLPALRADDLAGEMLAEVASLAAYRTAERHSTFSRANVLAEVHRQLHGVRFSSPDERVAVAERTAGMALGEAIQVTAPELHHTPGRFRRADGTSRMRPKNHHLYTTATLLDAEARLFEVGRKTDGPVITVATVARVAEANLAGRGYTMTTDQALAVEKIATSGRRLDVLVGPAGTGKSTTMAGLRAAWEAEQGPSSVVGLAPSAAAAEVLADELGIDTENTAKWLHEWRQTATRRAERARLRHQQAAVPTLSASTAVARRVDGLDALVDQWSFKSGQLVIVDEASLVGTFALDELVSAAEEAGVKVVLVGDPFQLSSVDAGGMFSSLVRDRNDIAPALTDVRRFTSEWERAASVELRVGGDRAIETYEDHGRIAGGTRDEMVEAIYRAWREDTEAGKESLMIAADGATVTALNERARTDRIAGGHVRQDGLVLHDGGIAAVGDEVVTRQNNRLLATGKRWVKNGDRWTVTSTNDDGSMTVKRAGGGEVVLPADYTAEHVELAYATTAHRAQGRTVDTAHAMVTSGTAREALYVAATRGRESNRLYVDTHYDPDPATSHEGMTPAQTARQVLYGCLRREGADLGAHDTIQASQDAAESLPALHAEYATIARAAQEDRWEALLDRSGLSADQLAAVRESEAHGPLLATFREAEARGVDLETAFPVLVTRRSLVEAEDVASALHDRVQGWTKVAGSKRVGATNLIAGLIPRAIGVTDPDMARALTERDRAIESRAQTLAEQAVERNAGWVRRLGRPPADPTQRAVWMSQVRVVAAYRDRWGVGGQAVVGREADVSTIEQLGHHKRAQLAAQKAQTISKLGAEQRQEHTNPTGPTAAVRSKTVEW